ncbi:MAG TPA: transglycosylase domain-containing protein [Candidatus Saccharimonadales bacterium]|nr:transglycosylase domain-containing protein [Candidatus Saccharimonadales bacterium]
MNLPDMRTLEYRLFAQRLLLSLASVLRIWGGRSRALWQYVLGLPLAVRVLLASAAAIVTCIALTAAVLVTVVFHSIYFDRSSLPEVGPFVAFEFSTIGYVYDVNGQPLAEMSREHRRITQYREIPPVVRDAVLSAEDNHFFSHNGVDYSTIPRVMEKIRVKTVLNRILRIGREDKADSLVMFRQGGSTITQQIVRGYFLGHLTGKENSNQLRPGLLSYLVGARSAKKLARKIEEIRLAVWMEEVMTRQFGSKRRAKEEILARYVSFVYMGNGQYGYATAAEAYFGRPLSSFTAADAGNAALLAGIPKSPRDYAPGPENEARALHRRNQILGLMEKHRYLSRNAAQTAEQLPLQWVTVQPAGEHGDIALQTPAVVAGALEELQGRYGKASAEDLFQGRIQVYSTTDIRVQRIVSEALERGLEAYETRHPKARGRVQGAVVVLRNRDAAILAETGGRRFYNQQVATYSDFNRATQSLRQPGSTMKPIVYLAAFRHGPFTLETIVPDSPISVPDGGKQATKSISNYDGRFRGWIPLREALAESRNAVAVWIVQQVGIDSLQETAQALGIKTALRPFFTTALGASEVNLLELANAYRTIATGNRANPRIIHQVLRRSGDLVAMDPDGPTVSVTDGPLLLIQEGLRGVVRIPTGTAHSLDSSSFPIAVMGKTGTTSNFRDALFVGSTFGAEGITVAIHIGFDDNHSLGPGETGGRVALPVFRQIMLAIYHDKIMEPAPRFPDDMEDRISAYLKSSVVEAPVVQQVISLPPPKPPPASALNVLRQYVQPRTQ